MTNLGIVAPRFAAADDIAITPSDDQAAIAAEFPPGTVQLERGGLKLGLQIPGGLLALGGATLLGASLLSRKAPGAAESRMLASALGIGGAMVGLGGAAVIGSELLPPKSRLAVATNIPTQQRAGEIAGTYAGRDVKVVQTVKGDWAVIDEGPLRSAPDYGYERGRDHYYGDGHYHGHHYYGDGHDHSPSYYPEPYYPGTGDYYPIPYDPSYPSGGTSGGDDYGYDGGYSGGTSGGDDYSYTPPPSYDPPSYDPPSYDPPSYDPPPSYDYGNSSSNGNPSYDDF